MTGKWEGMEVERRTVEGRMDVSVFSSRLVVRGLQVFEGWV